MNGVDERILIDPHICHDKPVVRGTRASVTVVLNALAGGDSVETIQQDYGFSLEDIRACLAFSGS